jgi:hypothetical protein
MLPRYELATKLAVLILIIIPIIGPIATAHTYKKQLPIESQQPIFYPVMIGIIVSVVTVAVSFILILLSVIGI